MLRVLLLAGTAAAGLVSESGNHLMTTGQNNINAMCTDGHFIFSATSAGQLIKSEPGTLNSFGVVEYGLATTNNFKSIEAIQVDQTDVYMTGKMGTTNQLVKVAKDNMKTFVKTTALTAGNAYAMVISGTHVFVGAATVPGKVTMYNKGDLSQAKQLTLPTGFNDIRSVEYNFAYDPQHIYVNCNTKPAKIVQVSIPDLTLGKTLTLQAGEDHVLTGTQMDSTHAYVATLTNPSKIVKIDLKTMTRVAAVTLAKEGKQLANVAAIGSDHAYVYAASYSTPGYLAKVNKATMQIEQLLTLTNAPLVDSMVVLKNGIFVGTDTAPARLVKLTGSSVAVNCVMNDWGKWTDCTKTCQGGQQERLRTVRVAAQDGGSPCPGDVKQTRACNAAIKCPVACVGGKVWTTIGSLPEKTCTDQNPMATSTGRHQCQCPPSAPYWHNSLNSAHFNHGHCVKAAVCPNKVVCDKISCAFQNGRVQVMRTKAGPISNYHCENMVGRIGGGCTCLCQQ
jgi:hypothetical protein